MRNSGISYVNSDAKSSFDGFCFNFGYFCPNFAQNRVWRAGVFSAVLLCRRHSIVRCNGGGLVYLAENFCLAENPRPHCAMMARRRSIRTRGRSHGRRGPVEGRWRAGRMSGEGRSKAGRIVWDSISTFCTLGISEMFWAGDG